MKTFCCSHEDTMFTYSNSFLHLLKNSSVSPNRVILLKWSVQNCSSSVLIHLNSLAAVFPCYAPISGAVRFSKACWLSSTCLPQHVNCYELQWDVTAHRASEAGDPGHLGWLSIDQEIIQKMQGLSRVCWIFNYWVICLYFKSIQEILQSFFIVYNNLN